MTFGKPVDEILTTRIKINYMTNAFLQAKIITK